MSGKGEKWTAEEVARLKELTAMGLRRRNIALKLGRSEDGVKKRAVLLGLSLKPNLKQQFTEKDLVSQHRDTRR